VRAGRERRAGGQFPRGHFLFVFPYFRVHDDVISAFPAHQPFSASGTRRITAISRRELRGFPGRPSDSAETGRNGRAFRVRN
jgi:hypothetical protein